MTLEEAKRRLGSIGILNDECSQDGGDLRIDRSASWSWIAMRDVADALGTEAIDLEGRDPYDTIPSSVGRYEHERGCSSCGHGSVLVVRKILE